jgi:DNA-binding ferritin-like protein
MPRPLGLHESLVRLLALLLVARRVYETAHWVAAGPNSYGDHLLFERIYESTQKSIDKVGERLVGEAGDRIHEEVGDFVQEYMNQNKGLSLKESTKKIETGLKEFCEMTAQAARNSGNLGVENLVSEIADKRDVVRYLLNRRFGS